MFLLLKKSKCGTMGHSGACLQSQHRREDTGLVSQSALDPDTLWPPQQACTQAYTHNRVAVTMTMTTMTTMTQKKIQKGGPQQLRALAILAEDQFVSLPRGSSQPPITPVSKDLSSDLRACALNAGGDLTCKQNTYTCKIKVSKYFTWVGLEKCLSTHFLFVKVSQIPYKPWLSPSETLH